MGLLSVPVFRALDGNADPSSGALLYVYTAGTTEPVTTYSDWALTTAQTFPVVSDATGRFAAVYVPAGRYKVRITTSAGALLVEVDDIEVEAPVLPIEILDDFAAVQSFERPDAIEVLALRGGGSPGDGFGGVWAYDASDNSSAHNPPSILVGNDGARYVPADRQDVDSPEEWLDDDRPSMLAGAIVSDRSTGVAWEVTASNASAGSEDGDYQVLTAGGVKSAYVAAWNNTLTPAHEGVTDPSDLTPTETRAMIQRLLDRAEVTKNEVMLPAHRNAWRTDQALHGRSDVRLINCGTLENAALPGADFLFKCLFFAGNHHADFYPSNGSQIAWFECDDVTTGEAMVLNAGANRTAGVAAISVGDLITIRSKAHFLLGPAGSEDEKPLYGMVAQVLSINSTSGVINIDRSIPEDWGDCLAGLATDPTLVTTTGETLFATKGFRIYSPGKLITDAAVHARGGTCDFVLDAAEIEGGGVFFGNLMIDSVIRAEKVLCPNTEKLADIAQNSLRLHGYAGSVVMKDSSTKPMITFNENPSYCSLTIESMHGAAFTGANGVCVFNSGRHNKVRIGNAAFPKIGGVAVSFANAEKTEPGDAQDETSDNVFELTGTGQFGSNLSRFVRASNGGGLNQRNMVRGGRWIGSPSADAANIDADEFILRDLRFEAGRIVPLANSTMVVQGVYAPGGIDYANTDRRDHVVSGLTEDKDWTTVGFRGALEDQVKSTTLNNQVFSYSVAAGIIKPGDILTIRVLADMVGGVDAKTIRIAASSNSQSTFLDYVAPFDYGGGVLFEASVYIISNSVARIVSNTPGNAASDGISGGNFDTSGLSVSVRAWVANASDGIANLHATILPVPRF